MKLGVLVSFAAVVLFLSALLTSSSPVPGQPQPAANIRQVTDDVLSDVVYAGSKYENEFKSFMAEYGKRYSSRDEYVYRLGVFARNLLRAAEHQALDPTAKHGVTQFSDLTPHEFESMYTGVKRGSAGLHTAGEGLPAAAFLEVDGLPESFDWREKGAVTDVKMQGSCGSCWAFSTTGTVEGAHFIATGKLLNLSEQQLVDCDHQCDIKEKEACDNGCGGGLMTNAYKYLMESGGLEEEASYPYSGKPGECKFEADKVAVKVVNYTTIAIDEQQIAANLVRHGPLAVGLNAVFMQTYMGGVSCPLVCFRRWINHGVLLVGYGRQGFSILRLSKQPYWIIKNSWGQKWGEQGYYRLCRGRAMCGINSMVSAVATRVSA